MQKEAGSPEIHNWGPVHLEAPVMALGSVLLLPQRWALLFPGCQLRTLDTAHVTPALSPIHPYQVVSTLDVAWG